MGSIEFPKIDEQMETNDSPEVESLNSLDVSLRDTNDGNDNSLNLNDDLASLNGKSNSIQSGGNFSRRSFESSSVFNSSFRPSFDDSLPSLGLNKLSIQTVSPLGPNSIFELIADVDARKKIASGSPLSPYRKPNSRAHHRQGPSVNIPPPTQKDIPLIQLKKTEKIQKDQLQQYLKDIAKAYEKHHLAKQVNSSNLKKLANAGKEEDDISTVPDIFFSDNFNLDDPRMFKIVSDNTDLSKITDTLQERLSNYLDIIEINLVSEISKSSGSFFDALNDLSEINEKNLQTIELIQGLRTKLDGLKKNKIEHNLKRIRLQNKRDNVSKLEQGLLQVNTILKEFDVANSLFLQSDYDNCLEKIDAIENLIKGDDPKEHLTKNWPYKLQNLNDLKALTPIKEKLSKLRGTTGESISKIFTSFLLADLRNHYEDINPEETLIRLTSNGTYIREIDPEFKKQLNAYIFGLTKSEVLASSFKSYQDQVVNEMKNIVRAFLPNEQLETDRLRSSDESTTTSANNNGSGKSLSSLIKSMTPREFEDMLIKIFTTVSEGLRRLTVHQKLLLDLTFNNHDINPSLIANLDIRECIHRSIEIIQIRLAKIIAVRKDINANLRIDFFLRFFYILSLFLTECENISGLNFKFLPDVLNQQIRSFNSTLYSINSKKISRSIEMEEWKPLIVTKHSQMIVNNIVNNENLDFGNTWKKQLMYFENDEVEKKKSEEEENSHKRSIVVGDKTFVANNSLLNLIAITEDIFILKSNFSHLSSVYEGNLVELYKYYNGRTMQSIRKSDNTLNKDKNLSVVGESLDCITELIHYIRADFNNLDHDEAYNNLLAIIKSSKAKIDSINTIPE